MQVKTNIGQFNITAKYIVSWSQIASDWFLVIDVFSTILFDYLIVIVYQFINILQLQKLYLVYIAKQIQVMSVSGSDSGNYGMLINTVFKQTDFNINKILHISLIVTVILFHLVDSIPLLLMEFNCYY